MQIYGILKPLGLKKLVNLGTSWKLANLGTSWQLRSVSRDPPHADGDAGAGVEGEGVANEVDEVVAGVPVHFAGDLDLDHAEGDLLRRDVDVEDDRPQVCDGWKLTLGWA